MFYLLDLSTRKSPIWAGRRAMLFIASVCLSWSAPGQAAQGATGEQVFEILASEIALQRGEPGLAYQTYLSLARQTGDPQLAQRAMEIAIAANAPGLALDAASLWDSLAPASDTKPKEVLVTLLMLNQRWSDAVPPAIALLRKQSAADQERTLKQFQPLIGRASDETAAMRAYFEIISALKPLPSDSGIMYTYAMAAEKVGRFEVMEETLRQILKKSPNDANALNALGYSLADRNERLPEALALITKAHNLAPQDAFILDSLGWVNFRLGKLPLARDQLSQAAKMKPEAEISAHLGEVYWAMGNIAEAEKAWREAEKMDANNATLRTTLKRFKPNWLMPNQANKIVWDGRFSIRMNGGAERPAEGGSGGFTLSQDALNDTLEIRNPLGGSIAKITITPGEAVLERGGKVTTAIDADTLVQSALGLPLPARGLSDWLRGQVRPGSPASLERNSDGIVSRISQDGWNLSYVWGNTSNKLEKLNMTRNTKTGPIDIRLVFDQIDD